MRFFDQPEQDYPEDERGDRLAEYCDQMDRLRAVTPHPSNPDWGAIAYFDPIKYPDDSSQERIRSYYARNFRGREFRFVELDASALEHGSPFLTKTAEKGFLSRGFYADIENANYGRGQGDNALVQSRLMQAACGHQLAKVAAFYAGEGKAARAWKEALGHLMGRFVVPVPLVEEDAVYWPRRTFEAPSTIHFAHTGKVETALRDGVADEFGLTRATGPEVASQIAFERTESVRLFNGATREALFLWQTQVLAMLRKSAWNATLSSNPAFRKFMKDLAGARRHLLAEVERHGRDVLDVGGLALEDPVRQSIAEMKDAYLDDLTDRAHGNYGPGLRLSEFRRGIDPSEFLVTAIHGSTYYPVGDPDCDYYDRHDPIYVLFPVASWLGCLKRHRYLALDTGTASMILAVVGVPNEDETTWSFESYEPLLRERFGDEAWDAIVETAHDVVAQQRSIPIVYDWTRTPLHPRFVERRNDALVLTGPLLDFPLRDAATWNQRALHLPDRLNLPGWN